MTATYLIDDDDVDGVRRGEVELTQMAEHGNVGSGRFRIDDAAGTLVVTGQKDVAVDEDDCSNPVAYRGFVADRTYERGKEATGPSREIDVAIEDENAVLGFRGITGSDRRRDAETVAERGAWIMASDYLAGLVVDNGRCDFSDEKGMDKADYTDQFPGDVLADMALAQGGVNHYVRTFDPYVGRELVFRDDNASTDDTSTIHISNVPGEDDQDTIFYPSKEFALRRNPGRVKSKLAYQYAKGRVVEERTDTADDFNGERFGVASNSNVKTAAKASDEAQNQLWQLHTEEDVIEGSILVPSTHADLLNQGDRVGVRLQHMTPEGYYDPDEWAWCRVLEMTRRPLLRPVAKYELRMRLSPQEAAPPTAGIVQRAFGRSASGGNTLSLPNNVTIGNLLVFACGARQDTTPNAPNIGPSLPRWGAGAWTKLPNFTINAGRTTAQVSGVAIWYKTADATDRTGFVAQAMGNYGIWEVEGGDISSATAIYLKEQADATSLDIGTLGGAAGDVAMMIHLWDEQATAPPFATPPHPALAGVTPDTDWTLQHYDSSYEGWPLLENAPVVAICDADTITGTINPRLTKTGLSNWGDATWCGAALLIPPL